MLPPLAGLVALLLSVSQAARIDGTWGPARISRSGATGRTRPVPIDSPVSVRLPLETHPGGWMGGRLYRRYFGQPEGSKIEAGPLGGTNRLIIGGGVGKPTWQRARPGPRPGGKRLAPGTPPVARPPHPPVPPPPPPPRGPA